jgi:hypothetical protein
MAEFPCERGSRRHGFEATVHAARTQAPTRLDDDVPNVPGIPVRAVE